MSDSPPIETEMIRAVNIGGRFALADGSLILRVSVQRNWAYVKAVKGGRPVRRRYRHAQMVLVEK